jgi:3-isopropylmalate/(R)-2-methylmalate dehydratase small subunit
MARGIVGGRNYGTGSSRPAARSLRNIGIACLIADPSTVSSSATANFGLLALECPGVSGLRRASDRRSVAHRFHSEEPGHRQGAAGTSGTADMLALMQGGGICSV